MNKFILCCFALSPLFVSCHSRKVKSIDDDYRSFYHSNVEWTDKLLKSDSTDCLFRMQTFKIVVYFDSAICMPCELRLIPRWQYMLYEMKDHSSYLDFIFIFNTLNEDEISRIFEEHDFPLPFYIDVGCELKKQNNLPNNRLYHTFLLDKNNKVMNIGSPIGNSEIWNMYKETIISK